jgi:hypothetical protein
VAQRSSGTHIAAAIFITAGMLAALSVRLLMHDQHILNVVLWIAIAASRLTYFIVGAVELAAEACFFPT